MSTDNGAEFQADEAYALACDENDPLARYRDEFHLPRRSDSLPVIYMAGNSLGLQPKSAHNAVEKELDTWAELGVDGHFSGDRPWYYYQDYVRDPSARLIGALSDEVVIMNTLTVNLHFMMMTFYRPTPERYKILVEYPAFPSDTYAVKTQILHHGFDPADALVAATPRPGEDVLRAEDLDELIDQYGDEIALVMMSGLNYFTGQVYDLERITRSARRKGCVIGLDLAHSVGNVPLDLHDWDVDFAVWCTYKYLNAGPGAIAGCFVHQRHAGNTDLPRLGGWWGNDPTTRFRMHLEPDFTPIAGAAGWQVSNPPVLALAPVAASLKMFDEVGILALRDKSIRLTGYLDYLITEMSSDRFEIITPDAADERGCQISVRICDHPKELRDSLQSSGVVADFREPDVLRFAPTPFYNSFHDVWRLSRLLQRHVTRQS